MPGLVTPSVTGIIFVQLLPWPKSVLRHPDGCELWVMAEPGVAITALPEPSAHNGHCGMEGPQAAAVADAEALGDMGVDTGAVASSFPRTSFAAGGAAAAAAPGVMAIMEPDEHLQPMPSAAGSAMISVSGSETIMFATGTGVHGAGAGLGPVSASGGVRATAQALRRPSLVQTALGLAPRPHSFTAAGAVSPNPTASVSGRLSKFTAAATAVLHAGQHVRRLSALRADQGLSLGHGASGASQMHHRLPTAASGEHRRSIIGLGRAEAWHTQYSSAWCAWHAWSAGPQQCSFIRGAQ